MKQYRSFSLIEMTIATAIIGILAALVVVAVFRAKSPIVYNQIVSDMNMLANAAEQFRNQYGYYPEDPGDNELINKGFLSTWPKPPCDHYSYKIYGQRYASTGSGLGARVALVNDNSWQQLPDRTYSNSNRDTNLYPTPCNALDPCASGEQHCDCPDGTTRTHCCNPSINHAVYHICLLYNEYHKINSNTSTYIEGNCSCNGTPDGWWCYDKSKPISEMPKNLTCKDLP